MLLILIGTVKSKLVTLAFLCCGEFTKNSNELLAMALAMPKMIVQKRSILETSTNTNPNSKTSIRTAPKDVNMLRNNRFHIVVRDFMDFADFKCKM